MMSINIEFIFDQLRQRFHGWCFESSIVIFELRVTVKYACYKAL